jgi:hypothetical protein
MASLNAQVFIVTVNLAVNIFIESVMIFALFNTRQGKPILVIDNKRTIISETSGTLTRLLNSGCCYLSFTSSK